jgi:hypothetical protein
MARISGSVFRSVKPDRQRYEFFRDQSAAESAGFP